MAANGHCCIAQPVMQANGSLEQCHEEHTVKILNGYKIVLCAAMLRANRVITVREPIYDISF